MTTSGGGTVVTDDPVVATGLCLPSGGSMAAADQDRVIEIIRETWTT